MLELAQESKSSVPPKQLQTCIQGDLDIMCIAVYFDADSMRRRDAWRGLSNCAVNGYYVVYARVLER
jgi:hypothetical protein